MGSTGGELEVVERVRERGSFGLQIPYFLVCMKWVFCGVAHDGASDHRGPDDGGFSIGVEVHTRKGVKPRAPRGGKEGGSVNKDTGGEGGFSDVKLTVN